MEAGGPAAPDLVTYALVAAACLDEGRAEADAVLARGAAFSKTRAAYRKPPKRGVLDRAAAALEVLHEDDRVIAVAKPNGVLSMAAGTTKRFATLPDAVALAAGVALSDLGGPNALGVVHRLDRDASGAMEKKPETPGIMLHAAVLAVSAFDLDVACAPPTWWRDAAPGLRDALGAAVR
ncbi:pseudouridine synthase [Aureococcus anophagefferens]|nr:pseudouridine synthase [Aureococcus anophagefferens]